MIESLRVKIIDAEGCKQDLIALLAEIDKQKRALKGQLRSSSDGNRTHEKRQEMIRKLKAREAQLKDLRLMVNNQIISLNQQAKSAEPVRLKPRKHALDYEDLFHLLAGGEIQINNTCLILKDVGATGIIAAVDNAAHLASINQSRLGQVKKIT